MARSVPNFIGFKASESDRTKLEMLRSLEGRGLSEILRDALREYFDRATREIYVHGRRPEQF